MGEPLHDPLIVKRSLYSRIYNWFPAFNDVFDEETFYIFAAVVVAGSIFIAFLLSRFIKLKEAY